MKRRSIAMMLCLSMLFQMPVIPADAKQPLQDENGKIVEVQRKIKLEDLSTFRKAKIDNAVKNCKKDGTYAAKQLNGLKSNKEAFEIGVREVLDEYYSQEEVDEAALLSFTAEVDEAAQEIVENYEEAAEERANAEELNYQTEKVMVAFPYGTPMETIQTIMENEAVGYELIDDGDYDIREDAPEYKKKRLEVLKDIKTDIVVLADIVLEDTVERAEEKFEQYDCVNYATCNAYLESDGTVTNTTQQFGGTGTSVTTNDPNFNSSTQWHMNITDVPRAWNRFSDSDVGQLYPIWVAVIDCGVQMDHPDLKGVLLTDESVDVTYNGKEDVDSAVKKLSSYTDKTKQYTGAHGTAVAGVIAAKANNSTLGAGVASIGSNATHRNSIQIMAIKCDKNSDGRHVTNGYLAKAVKYAVENLADVINISYSAIKDDYSSTAYTNLETQIANAIKAQVTVVCSVGNDYGDEPRYPAAFDGVIGVGAVDNEKDLTQYTNESDALDIVAPAGQDEYGQIYILKPTTNSNGYGYSDGTSYATPQVAATVAMMLSLNPYLTPAQIWTRLKNRSTESVKGILSEKTYPLLNVGKSVDLTDYVPFP